MIQKIIQKIVRILNRKTLFPVIMNNWKGVRNPAVIAEFVNSGYFRRSLKPHQPNLKGIKNVLVIAPHQDDEAIGCGGLLLKLKDQAKITVIFVTNGEQSNKEMGPKESINIRNQEAEKALKHINGKAIFLGLPNNNLNIDDKNIFLLRSSLSKYKPDLILAPWIFDRPYKHRIVNYLLYLSLDGLKPYQSIPIWNYQVHNVVYPNVVVDISEVIKQKQEMILEYTSQVQDKSPYDHYILGMNQWNGQYLLNKRGFGEVFFALPVNEYLSVFSKFISHNRDIYLEK